MNLSAKKKILIGLLLLLTVGLLWNSRPRTAEAMLGLNADDFTSIAANCVIGDVRDGKPVHDVYELSQLQPEDHHFAALLSRCRAAATAPAPSICSPSPAAAWRATAAPALSTSRWPPGSDTPSSPSSRPTSCP